MLSPKQVQMFESVARSYPQLREHLSAELSKKIEVLVCSNDVDHLRRAQGYAQSLRDIIGLLDLHLSPSRQRAGSST